MIRRPHTPQPPTTHVTGFNIQFIRDAKPHAIAIQKQVSVRLEISSTLVRLRFRCPVCQALTDTPAIEWYDHTGQNRPTALTLKHRHFNTAEAVDCGSGCSAIYVQNNSMCVLARTTAE